MIIAGRYEVRRSLGQGGYGEVYEVFDHHMTQTCALKLLKSTPLGTWTEAQIMRQVRGEFILTVLNADVASGRAYVVTDLATNGTLADRIVSGVGVPVGLAVRWARQACQGVARLHDHRLLHCDIKPGNIFLTDRDDALVGDLGLCQHPDATGLVFPAGSPPTMAPEVAGPYSTGSPIRCYSARSDVYSLGATLYWMLAGTPCHPGAGAAFIATAPQPDLWEVAPHVTQGLRDIVNKAITSDPAARYASPADLDAALGGRTLPPRVWERVPPHPGHEQCFVGAKTGASELQVCASPTGVRTQIKIEVQHAGTGRAVKKGSRTVARSRLAAGLRSAFNACP